MAVETKFLDIPCKEYNRKQMAEYNALYEGGEAASGPMNADGTFEYNKGFFKIWLPKKHIEQEDAYMDRIRMATYVNHVGSIIDFYASLLFSDPPRVEGFKVNNNYYQSFLANVDGKNTTWPAFWKDVFIKLVNFKRVFIWTDLPDYDGVITNRAQQEEKGLLNVRLLTYAQEVHYWEEEETADGKNHLKKVLFSEYREERPSIESEPVCYKIWTYIDDKVVKRWKAKVGESTATALPTIEHRNKFIPVIKIEISDGLWMAKKLRDPAIAYFRAQNDHDFSLSRAAHCVPFFKNEFGDGKFIPLTNYGISLGKNDEAGFLEPSGKSFAYTENNLSIKRDEIYRVIHQMALAAGSDASRIRLSGDSKREDWRETETATLPYSIILKESMSILFRVIFKIRSETEETFSIKGFEGWNKENVLKIAELFSLTDTQVKSEKYRKTLAKRMASKALFDQPLETLEEIFKEIDAADYSNDLYIPEVNPQNDPGAQENNVENVSLDRAAKAVK